MLRRGISDEALRFVLDNYHTRRAAPRREGSGPSDILMGEFEGRLLRVYVVRDAYPFIVKSAAWEEPAHGF